MEEYLVTQQRIRELFAQQCMLEEALEQVKQEIRDLEE